MIAQAINQYLTDNNINLEDLCAKAGLDPAQASRAFRSEYNFSIEEYARICTALEVPLDLFFPVRQ